MKRFADMNDTQLLKSFAEENSQSAFESIVERYLPLVIGTARRITNDAALAEEIAQAVFVLLAKKAHTLSSATIVSGWLYRTTCFVAKRALVAERRRRRREQEAVAMQIHDQKDPVWEKLVPELDHAVCQLAEKDREALLLRYFQEKSNREVAQALGIEEEAAKKRVGRAVEKLRAIFLRRGTAISAAALVAGISKETSAATLTAGSLNAAALAATATSTSAAATMPLVAQVLEAWRWSLLKTIGLGGAAVLGLALLLAHFSSMPPNSFTQRRSNQNQAAVVDQGASVSRQASGESPRDPPTDPASTRTLVIKVLDAVTSQPIANAALTHSAQFQLSPGQMPTPARTDKDGTVTLRIPKDLPGDDRQNQFSVYVEANEYARRTINWLCTTGFALSIVSSNYTVRLESGLTLSGTVTDEKGNPLAGAKIGGLGNGYRGYSTSIDESGMVISPPEIREEDFPEFHIDVNSAKAPSTDANGRFLIEHFPSDLKAVVLELMGPDGARARYRTPQGKKLTIDEMPEVSLLDLRSGTARLVIPRGIVLEGDVVNDFGEPVPHAHLMLRSLQWSALVDRARTETDAAGHFWLSNAAPREMFLVASSPRYASAGKLLDPRLITTPIHLQLSAPTPLEGRVIDDSGHPVPDAKLSTLDYQMSRAGLGFKWSAATDANGRFSWPDAPTNEMPITVVAADFAPKLAYLRAGTNDHTIVLRSQEMYSVVHVSGRVVDQESGEPVDECTVKICHSISGSLPERPAVTNVVKHGKLDLTIPASQVRIESALFWVLQVEKDGYETAATRGYDFAEGDQELEIRLRKGGDIEGTVWTPTGEPAANAQLALPQDGEPALTSMAGQFSTRSLRGTTDASGRFQLKKLFQARSLIVFHDSGWARVELTPGHQSVNLQLTSWSRIEGTLLTGQTPVAGQQIGLKKLIWTWDDGLATLLSAKTDPEGRFVFEKVLPGEYQVCAQVQKPFMMQDTEVLQTPVNLGLAETQKVNLSPSGLSVTAHLRKPASLNTFSWESALATLTRDVPSPSEPAQGDYVNNESLRAARLRYAHDPEVQSARRQVRTYVAQLTSDGAACFAQVPPGQYLLEVRLFGPRDPRNFGVQENVAAQLRARVIVKDGEVTNGMDLGQFSIEPL